MTATPSIFSHELLLGTAELPDDFDATLPVNGARDVAAWLAAGSIDNSISHTIRNEVADRLNGITGDFADAVTDAVTAILHAVCDRVRDDAGDVWTWTTGRNWRFRTVTDDEAAAALSAVGERVGRRLFSRTAFPVAAVAVAVAGGILFAARVACPVAAEAAA